jgi:hypothetical protein
MFDTDNINDFVDVETFIDISNEPLESSVLIGVENIFKEHLKECKSDIHGLGNINLFKIKSGDKLIIYRSESTIKFIKKHHLEKETDNYIEKQYIVENIQIEFYSVNPHKETLLPMIKIAIFLKNI